MDSGVPKDLVFAQTDDHKASAKLIRTAIRKKWSVTIRVEEWSLGALPSAPVWMITIADGTRESTAGATDIEEACRAALRAHAATA